MYDLIINNVTDNCKDRLPKSAEGFFHSRFHEGDIIGFLGRSNCGIYKFEHVQKNVEISSANVKFTCNKKQIVISCIVWISCDKNYPFLVIELMLDYVLRLNKRLVLPLASGIEKSEFLELYNNFTKECCVTLRTNRKFDPHYKRRCVLDDNTSLNINGMIKSAYVYNVICEIIEINTLNFFAVDLVKAAANSGES